MLTLALDLGYLRHEKADLVAVEFGDRAILLLHDYCELSCDEVTYATGMGGSEVAKNPDHDRHGFQQAYDYIKF